MSEARILVVDDDEKAQSEMRAFLESDGFEVHSATSGKQALDSAYTLDPDLIVLDIDLPNLEDLERLDGLRVLELVRQDSSTPIIMLTGTALDSVKVFALEMGADDYLTKPFYPKELIARIRAVLRRGGAASERNSLLQFERLKIDLGGRKVWLGDEEVYLTSLEFNLLATLAKRPGWVFSRELLLRRVWQYEFIGDERVVDTHIGHLRKKVEADPRKPRFIITVHGSGYRFETG